MCANSFSEERRREREREGKGEGKGERARMFDRREEHVSFTFDDRYEEKHRTSKRQECSMCGDVGFPDQLQQCTRCHFRFQHTYCCNSKEGLGTGAWMCDWCQLAKDEEARSDRGAAVSSGESGALEFLLKAALTEAGVVEAAAGGVQMQSSSVEGGGGGGSFCSSSIESVKGDEVSFGDAGDASCSNRERERERMSSEGDEATTTFACSALALADSGGCDPKRNPKLLRCSSKTSQKRRHRSLLEQQCGSVQLKRLSSLKGAKSAIACDPPKSFVRRYKSLSDISF